MNGDPNSCFVADPADRRRAQMHRAALRFAPVLPLGTLAGCVAVALCLWPVTPPALLATWSNFALLLVTAVWAAGQSLRSRSGRLPAIGAAACRRWLVSSSLAVGVFWGATSLLLFPADSPLHQGLLVLIVANVAALGLPLFALDRITFFTLAAPALLPMALTLLTSPAAAPPATMGSLLLLVFAAYFVVAEIIRKFLEEDDAAHRILYHRATHDSLVDLPNHAEFQRRVHRLESAPAAPYAVVFIDLDHFKDVNDTAGHGAGDCLLRQVGTILRDEKRKTDVAARVGGDEFAILMELCSDHEALRVATAIRRRVSELGIGGGRRVTASIGIACSADAGSARSVLEAADQACYAAKRAGRNRIERSTRRRSRAGVPEAATGGNLSSADSCSLQFKENSDGAACSGVG
jgi:diguanylate cyclase (GGDEF)-like protein